MPINRPFGAPNPSSRLTASTISSSAKTRSDGIESHTNHTSNESIMKRTTNLTRTRSLRLPSRSRDQYLMSGHLMQSNTTEDNHLSPKNTYQSRLSSGRHVTDMSASMQSSHELSLNANKKWKNQSFGLKEALIPKFVRNSFGKSNKSNGLDDKYEDKYRKRVSAEQRDHFEVNGGPRSPATPHTLHSPSSPMSNSSRDSGIIGINCGNCDKNNLKHFRKLSEEHERLQMEYSRVRLQLIETTATLPNKLVSIDSQQQVSDNDTQLELKKEKSLANNYKTEIIRLQEELKRLQRKYWENIISQKSVNRSQTNGCKAAADSLSNSSNSQNASLDLEDIKHTELEHKVQTLENKILELENETKEAKESIEFLTSERTVLADSLKETEESLFKERLDWIKEKETFDKVKVWSKNVYEKLKEKSEKLKEMETTVTEKDTQIEKLMQTNKNNENFVQNSSKLLNKIREKFITHMRKNKSIDNSVIVSKLWPQFDSSNLIECKDIPFDDSIIEEIFGGNNWDSKETEELKHKTNEIIKENVLLKRGLNEKDLIISEKNEFFDHLKSENDSNAKKIIKLNNELDLLTEKYRCSESVNKELKTILDKSDPKWTSSESIGSLRIQNVSLKESLALKEEMIEKLGAKYARNRKVWEENDKKATEEIKKLDDIVDHVIDTLKSLPENYRNLGQIQEMLDLLTEENTSSN